jgi:hypothetical protein
MGQSCDPVRKGPLHLALTTTAPHKAGDGTLPFSFFQRSFYQKASRLLLDPVTGTVNKALAEYFKHSQTVATIPFYLNKDTRIIIRKLYTLR